MAETNPYQTAGTQAGPSPTGAARKSSLQDHPTDAHPGRLIQNLIHSMISAAHIAFRGRESIFHSSEPNYEVGMRLLASIPYSSEPSSHDPGIPDGGGATVILCRPGCLELDSRS